MKLLIDMNLSPRWVDVFAKEGWQSVHWSSVGEPGASDKDIMNWARVNGYVVFTHDLDFSALLAATQAVGPSVIQVRTQNVLPSALGSIVTRAIQQFREQLAAGALISVDVQRARARVLPFDL